MRLVFSIVLISLSGDLLETGKPESLDQLQFFRTNPLRLQVGAISDFMSFTNQI